VADIDIRIQGKAGRITLSRPGALNALSYEMALEIEAALDEWAVDPSVDLVVIDAEGEKAFCAGGDIQELYDTAKAGDFEYGRKFWHDEYRMNAKLFNFPKPYVAFMQGFTMGGGVGISCHGSHRIVCENSQIAMPECGIGLVPDVGGSLLLARAPGHLGEYLGCTAARMDAGNAIYAGFADYYIERAAWPALIEALEGGDLEAIEKAALPAPVASLKAEQAEIDRSFEGRTVGDIIRGFSGSDWEQKTEKACAAIARFRPNAHWSLCAVCAASIALKARSAWNIGSHFARPPKAISSKASALRSLTKTGTRNGLRQP